MIQDLLFSPQTVSFEQSLAQDALRLAVNIANGCGLPDKEVTQQTKDIAPFLIHLSEEKLRSFLEQVLLGPSVSLALQWLFDSGILAVVLPEMIPTVDLAQEAGRKHKNVWEHTKQVVKQSKKIVSLRWAALFHDIGKVSTREISSDDKVTFHGHAEAGAQIFDQIARRLNFEEALQKQVNFLILNHLRASQYDENWTDSAVRRFDRNMGEYLDLLIALTRADITSAQQNKREDAKKRIDELEQRIATLREMDARIPLLPSGLGNDIMVHFGIGPGCLIGKIKKDLQKAIEKEEILGHQNSQYYIDYIKHFCDRWIEKINQ